MEGTYTVPTRNIMRPADVAGLNGYLYGTNGSTSSPYSMLQTTQKALETLLRVANGQVRFDLFAKKPLKHSNVYLTVASRFQKNVGK